MSNKKQTAIQELISEMEELKKTKLYVNSFKAIDDCIALAYNKLAMEIDQHMTSFNKGYIDGYAEIDGDKPKGFEEYFTETYEQ